MNAKQRSIKGDFIGFTLGNIHSSELGLMRVSDGSRYNEDLLPPLQDKKAQVAGRDGEVYFGSQYITKPIKVPVAFDNMREEEFSKLRRLLAVKKPQVLWFDENPYKQWLVKAATAQSFKWVCFDEYRNGKKERIYKGEGTLEFSCFSSYATSRLTYLDDKVMVFLDGEYVNKELSELDNFEEWKKSSGLRTREDEEYHLSYNHYYKRGDYSSLNEPNFQLRKDGVFIYNAGDIPIKPLITFQPEQAEVSDLTFSLYSFDHTNYQFSKISDITFSKNLLLQYSKEDTHMILDSKLKMLKGAKIVGNDSTKQMTGRVYNKFHKGGDYFEIPVSDEGVYFIESNIPISVEYTHQYY